MSSRRATVRILAAGYVISLAACIGSMVFLGFRLPPVTPENQTEEVPGSERFSLRPGDILCRPNLCWLPGTSDVPAGRNFGHVVIVVEGACESTVSATLEKAVVYEAVVFDQTTRSFIRNPQNQVRKTSAAVSFGKRFEGIRYRLRTDLTGFQTAMLKEYFRKQTGHSHYDLFGPKAASGTYKIPGGEPGSIVQVNWNCATYAWNAFAFSAGADLDANGGIWVYPNDIIRSPVFDHPGGRVRF